MAFGAALFSGRGIASVVIACCLIVIGRLSGVAATGAGLHAGAAVVDITPPSLPVRVNGNMLERKTDRISDRVAARALVLQQGETTIVLCVVDSCMLPRELIDAAKEQAARATGIPTDRMMVSATHTHSAPSAMGVLGSDADAVYVDWLPGKIAEVIANAARQLAPARLGWTSIDAWKLTHNRRWIRRPDRLLSDPFGQLSVRANIHPGYESPDVTGPSGPSDPELSLVSVQARDGRPLALFANFSQHYKGAPPLSADYAGKFASRVGEALGAGPDFVGILSQGTSGDTMWMDYSQPQREVPLDEYVASLIAVAAQAYPTIEYRDTVPLAMAETKLRLERRVPDTSRLAWAKEVVGAMGTRAVPIDRREVYAREQLLLAAEPERELKLQAIRIGELGITALPNEVFALTGLKLKALSPLRRTFNISLANGAEGYIPPPEQHRLGGYTTWPARTAALEERAEPQIVDALLELLEKVGGARRHSAADQPGEYAMAVLAGKPVAYWPLNEFSPAEPIRDLSGHNQHGRYEGGVAVYLSGVQSRLQGDAIAAVPEATGPFSKNGINRAPHLAGGRIAAEIRLRNEEYSIEVWCWNGLPGDVREHTGILFSRGADGDTLGISGTADPAAAPRLFFRSVLGGDPKHGRTTLQTRRWYHVVLVRANDDVKVYLDGELEFQGAAPSLRVNSPIVYLGGGATNAANFEGKLDEVAIFDRALSAEEIGRHFAASKRGASRTIR